MSYLFVHAFEAGGVRETFQQLDHAGIWLLVTGRFTPVQVLVLPTRFRRALLWSVWAIALPGVASTLFFPGAVPSWVTVLCYIGFAPVGTPLAVWLVATRGLR